MRRFMAMVAAACLSIGAMFPVQADPLDDLPWKPGPTTGDLGGKAVIKVPEGYRFLAPAGARELNRLTENPDPGRDEYVLAKDDLSWIAFFS